MGCDPDEQADGHGPDTGICTAATTSAAAAGGGDGDLGCVGPVRIGAVRISVVCFRSSVRHILTRRGGFRKKFVPKAICSDSMSKLAYAC